MLTDKFVRSNKKHIVNDLPIIDHNQRLRVSNGRVVWNGNLTLGKSPYTWAEKVSASNATSTWVSADVSVNMAVTGNGGYVIRKTREAFNYQAGKPQILLATGILPKANQVTARIGMFSSGFVAPYTPTDGIYFMTHNNVAYVVVCKGGVETAIPQSEWSEDKLDGTGQSRYIIDFSKIQLFVIDFEWLGVGPIRFGFQINGITVYCHIIYTSNISTSVYMRNCTHPVRYEIRSTGGTATMVSQCSSVVQDGGEVNFGIVGSADTDGTSVSVAAGATRFIAAARLNPLTPNHQFELVSSYLYNSAANTLLQWYLLWNPTFETAPTWIDFPDAALQIALGSVSTRLITANGFQMASGFTSTKDERTSEHESRTTLSLGCDVEGNMDVIALCAKSLSGTCTIYGGMQMRQLL